MVAPAFQFRPYQLRYLSNPARFIALMWCRQTGKDTVAAYRVTTDCIEHDVRGESTTWIIIAASLRQAKETARKVRRFIRAYEIAAKALGVEYFEDVKLNSFEFEFPNGSRIITVPANPDTIAGLTGNVLFSEFALCKNSYEMFSTIYPTIASSDEFKMHVITTPRGKKNKFWDIWSDTSGAWAKEKLTIFDAVAQGLKIDIDELRAGMGSDEEGWRQEFMCEFLDEVSAFLTHELIASCEDPLAGNPDKIIVGGPIYVGVDIGRRHDLTVFWELEIAGDVGWTRSVTRLRNTPFRAQEELLRTILRHPRVVRCSIDETGIGMQLAENMKADFPGRVEPVTFNVNTKSAMAEGLKTDFEDRALRIPIDGDIRTSLHSVKRVATTGGNFRYDAERDEAGHADEFWALALARDAWKGGKGMVKGLPVGLWGRALASSAA
ncbi:MAG TPA: terminase family protein [Sumerlaeia bacterium]|nr:terminase family protein [Sumerlaeia bacterium]